MDAERMSVRSLMYGFGDDRNPANDTVSVMEEILIEYITDIVSLVLITSIYPSDILSSAKLLRGHRERTAFPSMTCAGHCHAQRMQRSLPVWKNFCSCKRTLNAHAHSSRSRTYSKQRDFDFWGSFFDLYYSAPFLSMRDHRQLRVRGIVFSHLGLLGAYLHDGKAIWRLGPSGCPPDDYRLNYFGSAVSSESRSRCDSWRRGAQTEIEGIIMIFVYTE